MGSERKGTPRISQASDSGEGVGARPSVRLDIQRGSRCRGRGGSRYSSGLMALRWRGPQVRGLHWRQRFSGGGKRCSRHGGDPWGAGSCERRGQRTTSEPPHPCVPESRGGEPAQGRGDMGGKGGSGGWEGIREGGRDVTGTREREGH